MYRLRVARSGRQHRAPASCRQSTHMPVVRLDVPRRRRRHRRNAPSCAFNYIIYTIFIQCYVMGRLDMRMGRFGCSLGPFWSCFFFHWGRFGRGRFGFSGPFSTYIGAVLALGRFGRTPYNILHSFINCQCFHTTMALHKSIYLLTYLH